MNNILTDAMKEKMEYRLGTFLTKSQAKKIDKLLPEHDIKLGERVCGDIEMELDGDWYWFTPRGGLEKANDTNPYEI